MVRRCVSSATVAVLMASILVVTTAPDPAVASPPLVPSYTSSTQALPYEGITTLDLHGDDEIAQVDFPFPVQFYGTAYTEGWVDTNGQVTFASQGQSFPDEDLEPIPSGSTPNATAYVFGDDLVVGPGSVVRTQVSGTAPNRAFLIEWSNVHRYEEWTDQLSAEVIFYESGDIRFNYSGLGADDDKRGANALVGLENAAGTVATQVLYHQATLTSGSSLLFHPASGAYSVTTQPFAYDGLTTVDLVGDDEIAPVTLPFPVPFYGGTYTQAWIDTNGQIAFADQGRSFPDEDLEQLPSGSTPNATVYVFGDDLAVVDGSVIRTATSGTAPNRKFLVEWHNVSRFDAPEQRLSAEVIFSENGDITLNYSGLDNDDEKGAHAVVGVENAAGNNGVQVLYHEPALVNGTATVLHPENLPVPYALSQISLPYDGLSTLELTGDDETAPLTLPFPFPFYGQSYGQAWVDTNGQLFFGEPDHSYPDEYLEAIPSASTPNATIYVFGDDLVVGPGSLIRTKLSGTAPNRTLLIEWSGVTRYENGDERLNAQVILAENGDITTNYSGLDNDHEKGAHALVGVENADGSTATQVLFHEPALQNGMAKTFHPQGSPVSSYTVTTHALAYDGVNAVDLRGDDEVAQIALPFPIPFYGQPYTSAWVDTNGQIAFVDQGQSFPDEHLEAIPSGSTPNATVYVFGDDLVVGDGSVIRTKTSGSAPNREFLVEWHNVQRFENSSQRLSAQVVFSEGGQITLNYSGLDSDEERGSTAVVGVENAAGSAATQVLFQEPLLANEGAQVFVPEGAGQEHEVATEGPNGVDVVVRSEDPIASYQVEVHADLEGSILAGSRQVSLAYDFSLDEGLTLNEADITIPYDPRRLNGVNPQNLRIYHLDSKYGLWHLAGDEQTVNAAAHTVTATVGHFSTYAIFPLDPHGWETFWDTKPVWCVPSGAGPSSNLDIAFVIDQSGSMDWNDPTGLRVDAAKGFVDAMRETDRAAAVGFDTSAYSYIGLTQLNTPANVTAVKNAIESARSILGGTDITVAVNGGVAAVMAGATTGRPRVVILLTDGESSYDPAATTAAHNNDVVFYTVGLGDAAGASTLQAIASGTGGRYLHLDQASQLPALYAELASDLVDPGTDTDNDGLTDCTERRGALVAPGFYVTDTAGGDPVQSGRYITTDPNDADTDNDGLSDGAEMGPVLDLRDNAAIAQEYAFLINAGITRLWNPHSDPRRSDSDGEGLQDPEEIDWHTNAFKKDTDGDGVSDFVEVELGMDPTDPDWNEVGRGTPGYPDVAPGTLFIPDNNSFPNWPGDTIGWNHESHLCTYNCGAIYDWAQDMYNGAAGQLPEFPQGVWCWLNSCLPEDFERSYIEEAVNHQGVYNLDGTVRLQFRRDLFSEVCWEVAEVPTSDCIDSRISAAANTPSTQQMSAIDTAAEILAIIGSIPGGTRPQLNAQQQAAKTRLEQLARQACANISRGSLSAQKWGEAVHNEFERLVQLERQTNPKFWGETGYLNGGLTSKNGSVRPAGSSWPDAVFGASQLQPEMLFDLKTGVKGLIQKWLTLLGTNLPLGYGNKPVYKLTC
jgi:hypothetical protein